MNKENGAGQRLHQIRQHREMSQGQIAKAIGVSVGSIQNYERGRVSITTNRLKQLARALQCEPADLLQPPGSPLPRYRFQRVNAVSRGHGALPWQMVLPLADDDDEE